MSNHTPGPWEIEDGFIVSNKCSVTICDPRCMDSRDSDNCAEMDANTYLIAAAPDLLSLLEEINMWDGLSTRQHSRIEKAIAKATGGMNEQT